MNLQLSGVTAIDPPIIRLPPTMTEMKIGTWMLSGSQVVKNGTIIERGYVFGYIIYIMLNTTDCKNVGAYLFCSILTLFYPFHLPTNSKI